MTTQQMLDERYGRVRSPRRRWVTGILTAVAAVAAGWFAWTVVSASLDDIAADGTAYEIVDEHAVVLTFQLSAPAGSAVACALEAQDEEHGVVGLSIVQIAASDQHTRAFRETIPRSRVPPRVWSTPAGCHKISGFISTRRPGRSRGVSP